MGFFRLFTKTCFQCNVRLTLPTEVTVRTLNEQKKKSNLLALLEHAIEQGSYRDAMLIIRHPLIHTALTQSEADTLLEQVSKRLWCQGDVMGAAMAGASSHTIESVIRKCIKGGHMRLAPELAHINGRSLLSSEIEEGCNVLLKENSDLSYLLDTLKLGASENYIRNLMYAFCALHKDHIADQLRKLIS